MKKHIFNVMLICLAVFCLSFTACLDSIDIEVTLLDVTANGIAGTTATTALTLTFNRPIPGLNADNITLSGVEGINKVGVSGSGPVYTLHISGFSSGGQVLVQVAREGFNITDPARLVTIFHVGTGKSVLFRSLTANGGPGETTTELTLHFVQEIEGLSEADIILSGVTGVTAGTLSEGIPGIFGGINYTLPISGFDFSGPLNVLVGRAGYAIVSPSRTVLIYHEDSPVVRFNSVTSDGSPTRTSTALTLSFSEPIPGLDASDITVRRVVGTEGGGNLTLENWDGTFTLSGIGPNYTLSLSGITASEFLAVGVAKEGFAIIYPPNSGNPPTMPVIIYHESSAAMNNVPSIVGTWRITGLMDYRFFADGTYVIWDLWKDMVEEEGTWEQSGNIVRMRVTRFHDRQETGADPVGMRSVGIIDGNVMFVLDWKNSLDDFIRMP